MVELCGGEGEGQIMLATELTQLRAMARELEAKMDPDRVAARELCRALASSVDRSIRLAASCFPPPEHPPPAAGNAGRDAAFKKRQVMVPGHGGLISGLRDRRSNALTCVSMQEGDGQGEEAGEGDVGAGHGVAGRRPELEEVRPEGHSWRQIPEVSIDVSISSIDDVTLTFR